MTIKQSTPQQSLEDQILSACVPKNEREWWACQHIKYLRDEVIAERNSDIKQLRQRVAELEKERDALKQQRDELLAELEELSLYVAYNGDDWVQKNAKAAIASIKEK